MVIGIKIAALRERAEQEMRCAISPEVAKLLVQKGFSVVVEHDIGASAKFYDQAYIDVGAKISAVPLEIIADADIILKVQPSPLQNKVNELEFAKPGALIIGMLSPYTNKEYLEKMAAKRLQAIAMELVPRISRTQNMDAMSSQSNLAGYRAVIEAVYNLERVMPMMMTAAGTLSPTKVLVLGAGVAGLQAIATAKRLGAVVAAYDVRAATKEQIESLGAKFVFPEETYADMEDKSGYAIQVSDSFQARQNSFLLSIIRNYDVVITTAQIPGKQAPRLINKAMIKTMRPGAVIVDMATSSGGNVEGTVVDAVVTIDNVTMIGWSNLSAKIATDSSKLYAKNIYNFLAYALFKDDSINFHDEIVKQMLVVHNGKIIIDRK